MADASPKFIYAHFVCGWMAELESMPEEAESHYRQGADLVLALIPSGFKGEISPLHLGNRLLLRVLSGHVHWLGQAGKVRKAIALARKMIQWKMDSGLDGQWRLHELLLMDRQLGAAQRLRMRIQGR